MHAAQSIAYTAWAIAHAAHLRLMRTAPAIELVQVRRETHTHRGNMSDTTSQREREREATRVRKR